MNRLVFHYLAIGLLAMSLTAAHAEPSPGHLSTSEETQTIKNPIPFKREETMASDIGQSLSVLVLLIALAWGGLYVSKKFMPKLAAKNAPGKRLQLIETQRLTPRTTLFVVQFDEKTLLLGQHGESITVLDTSPAGEQPPHATPA
jgi:flagellar biogenesis protein FliO